MKVKLASIFFALLILVSVLSGCGSNIKVKVPDVKDILSQQTTANDVNSKDYEKVAETDYLKLLLNKNTTHFIVVDKTDGKEYSSLPAQQLDGSVGINSLFDISYMNSTGTVASMYSFEDAVSKGQFKIENIKNGVKIVFSLGNINEELFCPTAFTVERFDEITSKIQKSFDKSQFKSMYYKVDISKITDSKEKSSLLNKYPRLKEEVMYVFKNDTVSLSIQRKINSILISTGYNEKDYEKDMADAKELEKNDYPVFNIPLYLQLDNDNFKVKIPTSEVSEYYGGTLLSINLLRYFNSPSLDTEGYYLLPDASGSTMNFYNGKNDKQAYSVQVYGRDYSVKIDEQIYRQDQAYLPVFASVTNSGSVFYNITSAASIATINATPGDNSVNSTAYTSFQYRQVSQTYLSSSSKEQGDFFNVTQKKLYDGDMELSMKFFDNNHSTLNDLASYYRQQLFNNDNTKSEEPLMLQFVGVDRINSSFMGVSTKIQKVYTTIPQVLSVLKELNSQGIDNMSVTLSGFFGDGLSQGYAANLKLNKKVGTEKDLKELKDWAKANSVKLYFDVDIQYVYSTGFMNFNAGKNVVSTIIKEAGKDYKYNMASYQLNTGDTFRYILNPVAINKSTDKVLKLADELGTGFCITNIGNSINSDFKESNAVARPDALEKLEENVKSITDKTDVITSGANAWTLPYVKAVKDIPMKAMQFDICDSTVPFLQMVIKGNVNYSDEARNTTGNTISSMLDTMRTGGALSYVLTYDDELTFTKTNNKNLTSTKYSVWKDTIIKDYKAIKEVEEHSSTGIVNSVMVSGQMYKTTYSDGYSMIANYSTEIKQYNSNNVEPFGYILVKGEQ